MQTFRLDDEYTIECQFVKTRAFRHDARLYRNGLLVSKTKVCYQNRTWERYEYQSVINKLLFGYFDEKEAKRYMAIVDAKSEEEIKHMFDPLKMVCALGDLMGGSKEEAVAFKKRMIATTPGIDFPEEFDELPTEEKERRINGALEVL